MTIAKGIGGGFPLGACLATERAAAGMGVGSHGSTYGGNPLACAVGVAVMDAVTAPGFLDGVSRVAGRLRQGLEGLVAAHPEVFEAVRGEGLMLGLKCRVPNTEVVRAGYEARVLVVGAADNVVRLLPALNLTETEADEALRRLEAAAASVEAAVA
jgi:acetylornithine/N-succinyldiaminopimelate aminotransferase